MSLMSQETLYIGLLYWVIWGPDFCIVTKFKVLSIAGVFYTVNVIISNLIARLIRAETYHSPPLKF
jgi:hypothetical protein